MCWKETEKGQGIGEYLARGPESQPDTVYNLDIFSS
jgi:hypothetical protein